jgi:hypothetical protein
MIKLTDILKEIYDKNLIGPEYGEGGQHIVYLYGDDKVIKFNHSGGELGYNAKILKKHPDVFPKVWDEGEDYIILDKLDDRKALKEISKIKSYLYSQSSEIPPKNSYIAKLSQKSRVKGPNYYDSNIIRVIYNNLEDNELKSQLKNELPSDLYNSLIENYYPLIQKIKNLPWDEKYEKDINVENFGYDLKGNLKLLDI